MTNLHAQHSKGWAGLTFVAVLVVATIVGGMPPAAGASPDVLSAYLASKHQALLVESWLAFPLGAFFLWFTVGMARYLRGNEAQDDGLPTYVLVAGTLTAAAAWSGAALMSALVYAPASAATSFIWILQTFANGAFLSMPLAVFMFAAAHSMRRHGSGPVWLVWLGYVAALGQAVATFGIFWASGLTADSLVLGFAGLLLFALFVVGASVHLIVSTGGAERPSVASPA